MPPPEVGMSTRALAETPLAPCTPETLLLGIVLGYGSRGLELRRREAKDRVGRLYEEGEDEFFLYSWESCCRGRRSNARRPEPAVSGRCFSGRLSVVPMAWHRFQRRLARDLILASSLSLGPFAREGLLARLDAGFRVRDFLSETNGGTSARDSEVVSLLDVIVRQADLLRWISGRSRESSTMALRGFEAGVSVRLFPMGRASGQSHEA